MNMEYLPLNSIVSFPVDNHMGQFCQIDQVHLLRQGGDMT